MNRKHLLGIGLLSAAVLLTGCLADTAESATDLVPISLTSVVEAQTSPAGRSATRTTATDLQSDQLPSGEPFYVHFPSGVKQLSGADLTGTTFTADGSGGTGSVTEQPFFARSATSATLCAYHGKSGGTAQVTEATTNFSVALDQSGDDGYKASDLLYATTSVDKAYPSVTAALQFTHKMSKVMVSVTLGAGISEVTAVHIIGGTRAIAIAHPATTDESASAYLGAASSEASNQLSDTDGERIILYSGTYNDQNTALECAGLIPPQTITGNFLQVVTSAGTATYSLASKTFAAGENYTYNILVNPASLGITTDITDWGAVGDPTSLANVGTATLYSRVLLSAIASTSTEYKDYYVGQDGYAYNSIDYATRSGTSAVARITYVGSVSGYFDNFLAIALEDASSSKAVWATQMSAANTWASSHSVTVGGTTYNSCSTSAYDQVTADASGTTSKPKSSGAVKGWRVPSVTDWKYIFDGIGGKEVDNSKVTDGIVYGTSTTSGNSDGSHRALLNIWCGQAWNATTKPQAVQSSIYWSSSERAEDTGRAWGYNFDISTFRWGLKTNADGYVRAVFAY